MIVDDYLDYLHESSMKKKIVTASVATALAVLGVTYQAYRKFMDVAEKSCKKSPDKEACMALFRYKAYKNRLASIKKRLKDCTKTNSPGKCRKIIRKTITSLRKRIK